MCVVIGELNSRLITAKDSVNRPQKYTKLEVIVHKIFFVDRKERSEASATMEDWQKPDLQEQEYWDCDDDGLPF